MFIRIISIAVLVSSARVAFAQQTTLPRGTHSYQVLGFYEGEAMAPWTAQLIVADTTVPGTKALALTYQTRLAPTGWVYQYTAVLPVTGMQVSSKWLSNGRLPSTCDAARDNDRIVADMGTFGKVSSRPLQHLAVPDFALASVLATQPLADQQTVKLHVFRCSPGADTPLAVHDLNAVVSSDVLARTPNVRPEPVWLVKGDQVFPYHAVIAKSDRQVLKVIMPQGTVGEMIEVYTRSR